MNKRFRSRIILMIILSVLMMSIKSSDGTINTNHNLTTQMVPQLEVVAHITNTGGDTFSTIAYDDVLIVLDMNSGLKFYNISDPANPVYETYTFDGGIAHDMYKVGNLLYLADHYQGLEIYNISNPFSPVKLGAIADAGDGEMDGVFVADELAYVAEWHDSSWDWSMKIINVTDPTTPIEVVEYTDDDNKFIRFYVKDGLCYTSCLEDGFKILNVTEPLSISEISHFTDLHYPFEFQMINDIVYLADGNGFNILDVSSIDAPTKIGSYNTTGVSFAVKVANDIAYLAEDDVGLHILNISDTQNIVKIGEFDVEPIVNMDIKDDLIFLSMHNNGLKILQISWVPETNDVSLPLYSIILILPVLFLIKKKRRRV